MKKVIAAIISLLFLLTLSGCGFKISYWNGMTKREVQENILNMLEEKYGEEFVILENHPAVSGEYYRSVCALKSDVDLIFEIKWKRYGEFCDTYIQSIVRREMKGIIDSVLSKYYNNFASEVEVRGLASGYDSGICSAKEASIKSFTEALPEDNSSHVWITFDEKEIGGDYESVEPALAEIVEGFELTNVVISCYYVDIETIQQCQDKILNHHSERGYDLGLDMDITLSRVIPEYRYAYGGVRYELRLSTIVDSSGTHDPDYVKTDEQSDEQSN